MPVRSSLARRTLLTAGLALSVSLATAVPVQAGPADRPVSETTTPVLLGQATIPTDTQFQGTTVGGLSGTAYDAERDVYYALSDDRSQLAPARFYTLDVDLSDGALDQGDVTVLAVTTLRGADGQTFPALSLDPEGLALTRSGTPHRGATDGSGRDRLPADLSGIRTAEKTLLLDLDTLGVRLDNLEALAFGPVLPDGRQSLLITSDDNFSTGQTTQFLAFAL